MYKICFYVPESHLEEVKLAIFNAGAGQLGGYKHCAWQVLGTGQFLPLAESHAFIGEKHKLTTVAEYMVELICVDEKVEGAIEALKAAHPYEMPAYQIWRIET
jgi:structural toxin protein (hemagglutinin/hemolysin) RtxA